MVRTITGKLDGRGKRVAIVVSRFNEFITQNLLDGCLDELSKLNVAKSNVTVVWVPGAFELPVVALKCAKKKTIDAVIGLGAVIRGETAHFDLVAEGAAEGLMQVSLTTGKPAVFGVLTTETLEQAYKRSGDGGENKGREAAQVAVEMVGALSKI